jgi:hypothetical protein
MRYAIPFSMVLMLGGAAAMAQDPPPPSSGRTAVQAQVQAAREKERAALQTFLDRQRPRADRVAAGQQLGRVAAKADVWALTAVLRDRGEDDALRALALEALPGSAGKEVIDETIAIVSDPADGGEVLKESATARLIVFSQFSRAGIDRAPEILDALHKAVRSENRAVREAAMGFLAVRNDPVAVGILEDTLKSPQVGAFPKSDAIAFLAANDPREHFGAIRPHLQDSQPETRVAAVMALGADPVSRPALVRMTAKSESPKVREAALQSLSANDKDFPAYAVKLAQDRQEDPHIRSIAVLELNKVLNRNQAPAEDAQRITTTLRTLLLDAANQPLEVRAASLESLSVHDPQFPSYIRQLTADPADPLRQRALQAIEKDSERRPPGHP